MSNAALTQPDNTASDTSGETTHQQPAHILLVDDERSILSSLRRMLRPCGYKLHLANSGAEALTVLEQQPIDLIMSDMRMPEMSGAELLKQCLQTYPDVPRILLTGYSDLASAVSAVNEGQIFRYVNKPWIDDELKQVIAEAVDHRMLKRDRDRLIALTAEQNKKLQGMNEELEARVKERTAKVIESANMLREANASLERSYSASVTVFGSLLAARAKVSRDEVRAMVEEAQTVGEALGMTPSELEQLSTACLLCDLGKLTLPDTLTNSAYMTLAAADKPLYETHPVEADAALMALEPLEQAAKMIRAHRERLDGRGYPDKLSGDDIPLGARILAVVKDFSSLVRGQLLQDRLSAEEAKEFLLHNKNVRYDPAVVDLYVKHLASGKSAHGNADELKLTMENLRPGMVLTRDLVNGNGTMILSEGQALTAGLVAKLQRLYENTGKQLAVYAKPAS